jgi:hypothetical protein
LTSAPQALFHNNSYGLLINLLPLTLGNKTYVAPTDTTATP